jgi:uridine phosphorylase
MLDRNHVLTEPKTLLQLELKRAGFDINNLNIPKRVFILADSIYDAMIAKNCGVYKYPLGGELFVFNNNENIGFIKGNMCSPAIATQAEDLIAGGVGELIHIGFAGGLQTDMRIGEIILTDGAFNDTAVARLYGFDCGFIETSESLTDELSKLLVCKSVDFKRGKHWTTDAGYRETWGQILDYRNQGALCVEIQKLRFLSYLCNYRYTQREWLELRLGRKYD